MLRYYRCVENPDHIIVLDLDDKEFKKLTSKFKKGHRACPSCRPNNSCMLPCDPPDTEGRFGGGYTFAACPSGHLTKISAFTSRFLHIKWGEESGEFINIPGEPEDIDNWISDGTILCRHLQEGGEICNSSVVVVAGKAEQPTANFIKTRVRVGDIWDKADAARPTKGEYDSDGYYRETEFERRNARRMKDMKAGKIEIFDEKTGGRKMIKRERISKPKGDIK